MIRPLSLMLAGLALLGAVGAPVSAQEAEPAPAPAPAPGKDGASAICRFHGEGCNAPPSQWAWQRLEPRTGTFSVELPCDERQAAVFGQVMAMGPSSFPAGSTRACMKANALFTATMIGVQGLPEDTKNPEMEGLLKGAPDMFTAITGRPSKTPPTMTTIDGRRAATRIDEKAGGHTRVAVIELGKYAIIMMLADVRADFPGTREEADAATTRFFNSLEIAQ